MRSGGSGNGTSLIRRTILKHGWGKFRFDVLVYAEGADYLNLLEQKAISAFNSQHPNGMNLEAGGGYASPHPETRRRISEANKGKKRTAEDRGRMSRALKDKFSAMSEEDRREHYERSIGKANKNRVVTESARVNMSRAAKTKAAANPSIQARFKGKKHSQEFCEMISKFNKEQATKRWADPVQRAKLVAAITAGHARRKERLAALEN